MVAMLIVHIVSLFWTICHTSTCNTSNITTDSDGVTQIQSYEHGDYNLQTLMSLTNGGNCNTVTIVGLMRVYAVQFAVEKINSNPLLLQNITLGYQMNDGCQNLGIHMARGIEIARQHRKNFCRKYDKNEKQNSNKNQENCNIMTDGKIHKSLNIAVIGAYKSYITLPLASLLGLHSIPQISYGSSSPLLSSPTAYGSFYRTIPSDINQIEVFVEILKNMNWTYVFAVGSNDEYGEWAISELKTKAMKNKICIIEEHYITLKTSDSTRTEDEAKDIVQHMIHESKANVVIMFNYAKGMAEYILREAGRMNLSRFWLTSEGWNPHILSTNVPPQQLQSVVTISLDKGHLQELNDYMYKRVEAFDPCDVWLRMLEKSKYKCSRHEIERAGSAETDCFNTSLLIEDMKKKNPDQVNSLVDAVYAIAHALEDIISHACANASRSAERCVPHVTVEELNSALKKVVFTTLQNKTVTFDECGDTTSISYTIENIQYTNGELNYKKVGRWSKAPSGGLIMDMSAIHWPQWSDRKVVISECSPPCQPGSYVEHKRGCCWHCRPCEKGKASNTTNAVRCLPCTAGFHTIDNINCLENISVYLTYDSPIGIMVISLSGIGFLLTTVGGVGFAVAKIMNLLDGTKTSLQLIAFPLLFLMFSYSPLHLLRPNPDVCKSIFICANILNALYAALLLVHNTYIQQIMESLHMKHKCLRLFNVLTLFFILVLVQIAILLPWEMTDNVALRHYESEVGKIFEDCELKGRAWLTALAVGYPYLLLVTAAVVSVSAVISISEYDNDKYLQPKFLSYTCITTCILTAADFLATTLSTQKYKTIMRALAVNGYGFIYICIMLVPTLHSAFSRGVGKSIPCTKKAYITENAKDVGVREAKKRGRKMVISTGYLDGAEEDSDIKEEISSPGPFPVEGDIFEGLRKDGQDDADVISSCINE